MLTGDAGQHADRVLTEYFGAETRAKLFAAYAADYPELDDIALRTAIMTDERYIIRTGRYADAQSVHAPVWRSRYDGPYSGQLADPRLAPHRELLDGAHGADGVGIWAGGDGVAANRHDAWGAFATAGADCLFLPAVVRRADIQADNTVTSDKVADAHISYSGKGVIDSSNRMGWLARFFNSKYAPY